jgi:hypothetical protein
VCEAGEVVAIAGWKPLAYGEQVGAVDLPRGAGSPSAWMPPDHVRLDAGCQEPGLPMPNPLESEAHPAGAIVQTAPVPKHQGDSIPSVQCQARRGRLRWWRGVPTKTRRAVVGRLRDAERAKPRMHDETVAPDQSASRGLEPLGARGRRSEAGGDEQADGRSDDARTRDTITTTTRAHHDQPNARTPALEHAAPGVEIVESS